MKTWYLFAAMGGVFGILALAGSNAKAETTVHRNVRGLPKGRATFIKPEGAPLPLPMLHGSPVNNVVQAREFAALLQAEFTNRDGALPADADPYYLDKYSKGLWPLPTWIDNPERFGTHNWRLYDEFGRGKSGHVGFGGSVADSFQRLASNPLFVAAATIAASAFGGPAGLAAYGAFNAYIVRGEELTAESVVLASARTYAVSQCGPACGAAFDFGVGVASGDSVDEAATNAALGAMTPEQRVYYEQARGMYEEVA